MFKIFFHFCLFFVPFFRGFFGKNFWTLKKWNKFPYSCQNSFYFLIACENFHAKWLNPQNHEIAISPFYNVIVQLSIQQKIQRILIFLIFLFYVGFLTSIELLRYFPFWECSIVFRYFSPSSNYFVA